MRKIQLIFLLLIASLLASLSFATEIPGNDSTISNPDISTKITEKTDNSYNVSVNPQTIINTCGNMVFGACQIPSYAHTKTILPLLIDAGFNNVRTDMWLETILPQNITYDDYINNVNDVQNPDTWDYSNMELAVLAKKAGMKVMMIISYCPAWLSYNGKTNGVPKDLKVYADIVRKVYSRYSNYIDWIEVYNEPGYFFTIENSPYLSVGKALADVYMTCVNVVKDLTPTMPMGGTSAVTWSDGGVGGTTNSDFFSDKRINKSNFNFYSHHVYGDYGIKTTKETVTRVKTELTKFGYGDLPIYFTEWSTSINNAADSITYTGTQSHIFVGNCLINWMRDGLTGAEHWNYLQAAHVGVTESGISTDGHGMYKWNTTTKQGELLPKAFVFKLMSKTLGLGIGENKVVETVSDALSLNIASFTNAAGITSTIFVNEKATDVVVNLSCTLSGVTSIEKNVVTYGNKGENAETVSFTTVNGVNLCQLTVPALSVTAVQYR